MYTPSILSRSIPTPYGVKGTTRVWLGVDNWDECDNTGTPTMQPIGFIWLYNLHYTV